MKIAVYFVLAMYSVNINLFVQRLRFYYFSRLFVDFCANFAIFLWLVQLQGEMADSVASAVAGEASSNLSWADFLQKKAEFSALPVPQDWRGWFSYKLLEVRATLLICYS